MRVEVGLLRAAAGRLDQLGADGVEAIASGRAVSPMDGAFGKACWAVGAALTPVVGAGVLASQGAVGSTRALARATWWYADLIESTDQLIADGLADLAGALP
ncbi:MAG: hypothetical protein ACSLEW_14520 [Nocardioides sp.]